MRYHSVNTQKFDQAEFLERTVWASESTITFHICATKRCYPDDCPSWHMEPCFLALEDPKWLRRIKSNYPEEFEEEEDEETFDQWLEIVRPELRGAQESINLEQICYHYKFCNGCPLSGGKVCWGNYYVERYTWFRCYRLESLILSKIKDLEESLTKKFGEGWIPHAIIGGLQNLLDGIISLLLLKVPKNKIERLYKKIDEIIKELEEVDSHE